jgi:hypothetical protein
VAEVVKQAAEAAQAVARRESEAAAAAKSEVRAAVIKAEGRAQEAEAQARAVAEEARAAEERKAKEAAEAEERARQRALEQAMVRAAEAERRATESESARDAAQEVLRLTELVLRGEMKETEDRCSRADDAAATEQAAAEAAAAATAKAESELDALRAERRTRGELDSLLRTEASSAQARAVELEQQLASALEAASSSAARVAEERQALELLRAEKAGWEEVQRAHRQENETLRVHAQAVEGRARESEKRREELMAKVEEMKVGRVELSTAAASERRRAELSELRELRQRETWAEERRKLLAELEASRRVQRGVEAQVTAMRHERRNQIVGYCAELAKWQV